MKTLPVRTFKAEIASTWSGAMACARLWRAPIGTTERRDTALDRTPMRDVNYATLFTYMYRRFGLPPLAGDGYKNLCGGWMLTSPSPSLLVRVSPNLKGPDYSFSPIYLRSREDDASRKDVAELNLDAATVSALKTAYQVVLLDLLRPVAVRDSHMNALGAVGDESPLLRCNRDGDFIYDASRHPSSGFGVPSGMVGTTAWPALCNLIGQAGNGDVAAGSLAVVAQLRAPVLVEAAEESAAVKRIILLGVGLGMGAVQVRTSLGRKSEVQALLEECTLFYSADPQKPADPARDEQVRRVLEETTPEVEAKAHGYLRRLAFDTESASMVVKEALTAQATTQAWNDLVETVPDEFPDEAIPAAFGQQQIDLPKWLRTRFDEGGHAHLTEWLDRTMAQRNGKQALGRIMMHLQSLQEESNQNRRTVQAGR